MASPNANNRRRGVTFELFVAKLLNGIKVGQLNKPWDVWLPGYAKVQTKKLKQWPSVQAILDMMDAIPAGDEARVVIIGDAPGPGKKVRGIVVFDLYEYAERHGA